MREPPTYTAFVADRRVGSGSLSAAARAARAALDSDPEAPVLVFNDEDGRQVDVDLRGNPDEVADRYAIAPVSRGPGRPRLGVVAREITLLPRHWDWLARQPGGASVALRKLVEEASRSGEARTRAAREAAYRFMTAMAGDWPGYEEACRALFAGDRVGLENTTAAWSPDVRAHVLALAGASEATATPRA